MCEDFVQCYDGRTASLEIPSVTSADAGTYTCVLVNDAGKTECSCEVSLYSLHLYPGLVVVNRSLA